MRFSYGSLQQKRASCNGRKAILRTSHSFLAIRKTAAELRTSVLRSLENLFSATHSMARVIILQLPSAFYDVRVLSAIWLRMTTVRASNETKLVCLMWTRHKCVLTKTWPARASWTVIGYIRLDCTDKVLVFMQQSSSFTFNTFLANISQGYIFKYHGRFMFLFFVWCWFSSYKSHLSICFILKIIILYVAPWLRALCNIRWCKVSVSLKTLTLIDDVVSGHQRCSIKIQTTWWRC